MECPAATELKRSMCRARHEKITRENGKVPAKRVMQRLRAAYNFALRVVDDSDSLPSNPVGSVTFHRERSSDRVILLESIVRSFPHKASSPKRRALHGPG